jgi:hypothetical protein
MKSADPPALPASILEYIQTTRYCYLSCLLSVEKVLRKRALIKRDFEKAARSYIIN